MKENAKEKDFGAIGSKKFFIGLATAAAVVIFVCILFVNNIRQTTANETERYLTELSASVVYSVDARLEANLDALESIASTYVELKKWNNIDKDYLQEKAERHKFESIYIMALDGTAVGTGGDSLEFSQSAAVMRALEGERIVANDAVIYGQTRNGFAYAVPIRENGAIIGAMIAGNTTQWIKDLLAQTYFEGDGFFHIIDANGGFVVKSTNSLAMREEDNFFYGLETGAAFHQDTSLDILKTAVEKNHRDTVYFTTNEDGLHKIGKIIPMTHHGFYLFLVVLESAASHQFDTLLAQGIWNIVLVSLLFAVLVSALLLTNQRSRRRLTALAFVDPVTGGFSQVRFELEAKRCIQAAAPGAYTFVTLNVTKFKWINDSFGTENGDRVLKHIYKVIASNLAEGELLCRSSSDNFELLIVSRGKEAVILNIERIAREVNAFNEEISEKYYLPMTAGVCLIYDPDLPIVHIRDRANVARKNGRTIAGNPLLSCGLYSDRERQRQLREKAIENKMNAALENRDFKVYLQPKVDLTRNQITGAEALVRWQDSEWGLVFPGDFMPFFEKNGFVVPLDLFVFEEACRVIRGWIDAGVKPVAVSVNLSRLHLYDPNFLESYISIQQRYQVPPHLLEIELTETLLFENLEQVARVVKQIHKAGFHCSMDDFGSGYSSLNLLKDVHVDALKLDGAFFRFQQEDSFRGKAIIKSVVELAKKLSMTTVSEGVETQEHMDFVRSIGCDMVQGYVISKPVEIQSFEQLAFGRKITDEMV